MALRRTKVNRHAQPRKAASKKGILLTLLVIVLFVLMLGEVMTYVVLSNNYNALSSQSSQGINQGEEIAMLQSSTSTFLRASLQASLNALIKYEETPTLRKSNFVNNTAFDISSIMGNGLIFGTPMLNYSGAPTMVNFTNTLITQAKAEGIGLSLINGTLNISQNSPYNLTATYTALAVVNTSSSSFIYPLSVAVSIPLNGTYDLLSAEEGRPTLLYIKHGIPQANLIGGIHASAGSTSPYLFSYSTAVIITNPSVPTCTNIPAAVKSINYTLVTPDAASIGVGICGMGGLVTYTHNASIPASATNVAPKPYLVYPSASGVINDIQNGTQVLLDGQDLALLNISAVKTAVQSQYFYPSQYTPSYLDLAQQSFNDRSPDGIFSFNPVSIQVPNFSTSSTYITIPYKSNLALSGSYSVSVWYMATQSPYNIYADSWVNTSGPGTSHAFDMELCMHIGGTCSSPNWGQEVDIGNAAGSWITNVYHPYQYSPHQWYNEVVTVNAIQTVVYLDGAKVASSTYAASTPKFLVPGDAITLSPSSNYAQGQEANLQVYNGALTPSQAQEIYQHGIDGTPAIGTNVVGWWPLNGNANDYSGYNDNGTVTSSTPFVYPSNYTIDPIFKGSNGQFNASQAYGLLNCQTLQKCSNESQAHIYLQKQPLSVSSGGTSLPETAALGMYNSILPRVSGNNGTQYGGFINESTGFPWMESASQSFSVSLWLDPQYVNGSILNEYASGGLVGTGVSQATLIDIYTTKVAGKRYYYYGFAMDSSACTQTQLLQINNWTNLAFSWNGVSGVYTGYINGVQQFSQSLGAGNIAPTASPGYIQIGGPDGGSFRCNVQDYFPMQGTYGDFQVYTNAITQNQAMSLYYNDSISGMTPYLKYSLSGGMAGGLNETPDLYGSDYGVLFNPNGANPGGVPCTSAQVENNTCAENYVAP
jgi:hypothetical protein